MQLFMDTAKRKFAACRGRPIGSKIIEYAANKRLAQEGTGLFENAASRIMVLSGGYEPILIFTF